MVGKRDYESVSSTEWQPITGCTKPIGTDPLQVNDPWQSSSAAATTPALPPGLCQGDRQANPSGAAASAAAPGPSGASAAAGASSAHALPPQVSWQNNSSWQNSSWNWHWPTGHAHGWQDHGWSSGGWNDRSFNYKGDFSDPPSWPGWMHRRFWIQAVRRWNKGSDLPTDRRADKVLRSLGWEMQPDFEHLLESQLTGESYLENIIDVINTKAGVREDDEKRRAFKAAIVDNQRRKDETFSQYAVRRLRDFSQASTYGVVIPSEFKATMLREGAGLSDQNHQNLSAILQGNDQCPDIMAKALGKLDVRPDRISAFATSEEMPETESYASYEQEEDNGDGDSESSVDQDTLLAELEPLDLTEDQVTQIYAVLDQKHDRRKKRTWKQNKEFKAQLKRNRGSFTKGEDEARSSKPTGQSGSRSKLNKEQLKKITRCRLCLRKGHWAEDCTADGKKHDKKPPPSAFSYASSEGMTSHSAFSFISLGALRRLVRQVQGDESKVPWSFLQIPTGEAILDIGATQDLIGDEALRAFENLLEALGLKCIEVDAPMTVPSGIGGIAKALRVVLVPVSPGGHPGVLEMTVLQGSIPPLLSVGFLEFLEASIDLPKNKIELGKLGCALPMKKLHTGHRTIQLFDWQKGKEFPMPEHLKERYGLEDGSFNLDVSSPYTKERPISLVSLQPHYSETKNEPNHISVTEVCDRSSAHESCQVDEPRFCRDFSACQSSQSAHVHDHGHFEGDSQLHAVEHDVHVPMEASGQSSGLQTSNNVDFMCDPQPTSNLKHMGCSQSTKPQFEVAHACDGRPLSLELRHATISTAEVEQCCGLPFGTDGAKPHRLQETCQIGATNQELSLRKDEVHRCRQSSTGTMHSSSRSTGASQQPVCELDSLWGMSKQAILRLEERSRTGSLLIEHPTQVESDSSTRTVSTGGPRLGSAVDQCYSGSNSDGRGCHEHPQCSTRPDGAGPDADQFLTAGTGSRPKPDAADGRQLSIECASTTNSDSGIHAPAEPHGGRGRLGQPHLSGSRESKQSELTRGLSWPKWMMLPGVVTTSWLIGWHQCSESLQQIIIPPHSRETTVMMRYDLNYDKESEPSSASQVCLGARECPGSNECPSPSEFPGDKECPHAKECPPCPERGGQEHDSLPRPRWLPHFVQRKRVSSSEEIPQLRDWQCIWLQVEDEETGHLLYSGPHMQEIPEISDSQRVAKTFWGLPNKLVQVLSKADLGSDIYRLNEAGETDENGSFWVFQSSLLSQGLLRDESPEISNEKARSDLSRCALNLMGMSKKGRQQNTGSQLDFVELFSPPRVTPIAQQMGLRVEEKRVFDISHGWDVRKKEDRQSFRKHQKLNKPAMMMMSPECRAFTQMLHIYIDRMCPEKRKKSLAEGLLMWDFSLEAAENQVREEAFFGLEHPSGAASWKLPQTQKLLRKDGIALITFDMCQFGLSVVENGELSQKSTKFATNNPWLALALWEAQCNGEHQHRHLIGGLPHRAQQYPRELCEAIARSALHVAAQLPFPNFLAEAAEVRFEETLVSSLSCFNEEEEAEEALEPLEEPQRTSQQEVHLSDSQRRLIHKVHVNSGHPDRTRMLRAFKAAGALPQVLKFIREQYNCEDCSLKRLPDNRRRAQLPRTFAFNRVLGMDYFYIKFQEQKVPILNMTCVGTSYQVAVRVPIPEGLKGGTPTSALTWKTFVETWQRYYGLPHLVICDPGNEFKGLFERGLELAGVLQHVTIPEQPWENGKCERHGGWLKDRLDNEIQGGRCILHTLSDLGEYMASLTGAKNRWLNKGGYTPSQLVFGELPRIPGELLAEDELGNNGLRDAYEDPMEIDEAAGEYRRRHQIRERARQAAMEQSSRDVIRKSHHAAPHQQRQWQPGQWVYVFRRAKQNQELHLRDRWVGPGVVVLCNNNTIYVGMRTRLWRCSSQQLRPALPSEILGRELITDPGLAELLRQVVSGSHAGAVDVEKEGPPPSSSSLGPVEHDEHGVSIGNEPTLANPQAVEPTPIESRVPARDIIAHAPQDSAPIPQEIIPSRRPSEASLESVQPPPGLRPQFSRRTSAEEPAAEPMATVEEEMDTRSSVPGMEKEESSAVLEPPTKVQRTSPRATASQTMAPASSSSTRAPGTPIDDLLSRIPRQTTPENERPTLTPVEEISSEQVVTRLVDEFNQMAAAHDSSRGPGRSDELSEQEQLFTEENWSGTFFNYQRGSQTMSWNDEEATWALVTNPKRNGEISLKELTEEERNLFEKSDEIEWEAILKTKAVRVLLGKEAEEMRRKYPDRIVSSRMVRRKKPLPELHSWKAKSRWCLHGHVDPDTGSLTTYAPTPQAEGIMLFLQAGLNMDMRFAFGDIKNAFCQSRRLKRPKGPLFAEPCDGLKLPPGALILIEVPVYGLDDAPAEWRATVASFLVEDLSFERNLVEPCWYSLFDKSGKCSAQILVEVDDFIIAAKEDFYPILQKKLTERFTFGKWDENEAEYAGRHVKCCGGHIEVEQSKYIIEQIHPIQLPRGRRQDKESALRPEEFEALRSLVYKVNWVARETRPEASGLASLMASKLPHATISDIQIINKFVNFLRATSERPIRIWKFHPDKMCYIVCTDAGGVNFKAVEMEDAEGLPTDATQGAWIVLSAEKLPEGRQGVRATPLAWRSSKLKRKVFSTFGGETQAMLQGVNEVDWMQIMYRDAVQHDVQLSSWRSSLSPHMVVLKGNCKMENRLPQCSVTDAKSLFDCLLRENPSGRQDRKSALELAIVLRDLQSTKSMVRWVPHQKMVVDCLTKMDPLKGNDALNQLVKSGWLSLVDVQEELKHRKEDASFKRRSHSASHRRLQAEYEANVDQLFSYVQKLLTNTSWGDCVLSA